MKTMLIDYAKEPHMERPLLVKILDERDNELLVDAGAGIMLLVPLPNGNWRNGWGTEFIEVLG